MQLPSKHSGNEQVQEFCCGADFEMMAFFRGDIVEQCSKPIGDLCSFYFLHPVVSLVTINDRAREIPDYLRSRL